MKIIQLMSGSYPPNEGVGSHVYAISKTLVNKGHSVKIIKRDYAINEIKVIQDSGIDIILIPVFKIPFLSTFIFKMKAKQYLKDEAVDIVHFHSPLVPFVKVNTSRYILTIHSTMKVDTSYIEAISINAILNKLMGRFLSPLIENKLLKNADKVIVVSNDIRDELNNSYKYVKDNIVYVPNGIDSTMFYNKNIKKENQIVYIGRLGYRKGLPLLIEAINNLKEKIIKQNYKIIFSGDGHLKEYLVNYIKKNNLSNIVTITSTKQSDINQLLNESKFLIMNSTYETGPRTVLESLFSGTPVIATKVGLLKYFEASDYINIPEHNIKATINAIEDAMSMNNYEYKELQQKCTKYIEKFDNNRIVEDIIKIYKD